MKKAKKILALLTVASLAIGPSSLVFAEDGMVVVSGDSGNVVKSKDGTPAENLDEKISGTGTLSKTQDEDEEDVDLDEKISNADGIVKSKDGTPAENLDQKISGNKTINKSGILPDKEPDTKKSYDDLEITKKYLYNSTGIEIGTYPSIKDAPTVNAKIERDLLKIKQGEFRPGNYDGYLVVAGEDSIVEFPAGNILSSNFKSSYTDPENRGRYAKVSVKIASTSSLGKLEPDTVILQYYVDKEDMSLMKKDAFETVIEELDVEETDLLPLVETAQKLGLTVTVVAETKDYVVTDGTITITINEKLEIYNKKKIVKLDVAPKMIGKTLFVPISYFIDIFGFELVEDGEGNYEETKDEVVLIPLRVVAEKLGYTVDWNAEVNGVDVVKGDVKVTFKQDVNLYNLNGKDYELEIAPTLVEETLQVPSTLFTKLLGVKLHVDAEGNIVVE